jgi:hypothetical protein
VPFSIVQPSTVCSRIIKAAPKAHAEHSLLPSISPNLPLSHGGRTASLFFDHL